MKTLSAGMLQHLATRTTTLAWMIKITREDGVVFRYVSGNEGIILNGETYQAAPGFSVSSLTSTLGFNVDTLELTVLANSDLEKADFLAGRWNNAQVDFNQYNWADPTDGFIPWPSYRVANVKPFRGGFVLELRDLRQLWRQDYTLTTGKTCQNRLGDSRCLVNLASFTFAFTVTSVQSRTRFTCSALAQTTDYFTEGSLTFADGRYEGLPLFIMSHSSGGVITLGAQLIEDVVVGQTGTITAGCLKRREDCRDKFNNILNMRAPGIDAPTIEELAGGE